MLTLYYQVESIIIVHNLQGTVMHSKSLLRGLFELRRNFRMIGLLPFSLRLMAKLPQFSREIREFLKKGGAIKKLYPILSDYNASAGEAKGHYFHQDLLVAQFIHSAKPRRHIDVGSRVDGFVAHVASFRKIEVFDYRDLNVSEHPNIHFKKFDILGSNLQNITDSLSCLHALEHFGLGRYGDPIDPEGHQKGFKKLIAMLERGGHLYLSVPIGSKSEVHFNAHRILNPTEVLTWSAAELRLITFSYIDDYGYLHRDSNVNTLSAELRYGCGVYTFLKL